ncbi:MAG: DUF1833 family protein [Hyphomicrobiaceae bacterium]
MSRELSATATAAFHAEHTEEILLCLLTIEHPDIPEGGVLRFVNNNETVASNGHTFEPYPFRAVIPGEDQDQPQGASIAISNVDRRLVRAVRSISGPPVVSIQAVLASDPDTIELEFTGMLMRNVRHNAMEITAELQFEPLLSEPVAGIITPQNFRGLF